MATNGPNLSGPPIPPGLRGTQLRAEGDRKKGEEERVNDFFLRRWQENCNLKALTMAKNPELQPEDRRRHPRYGFQVHVDYRNIDRVFSAVTRNVSKGGCFIETESPLPPGTRIWLEFSFKDIPIRLGSIQGRVAWSTPPGDPHPGMGIEYENVPDVVEELMDEFIEHVRKGQEPGSSP